MPKYFVEQTCFHLGLLCTRGEVVDLADNKGQEKNLVELKEAKAKESFTDESAEKGKK